MGFINFKDFPSFQMEFGEKYASRILGSKILENLSESTNSIIGGSADLAASTKQIIDEKLFIY